jgi:nitroreductase
MDAMNAILGRRSVRKYTDQPIPEIYVKQLLEAGMSAPSAGNERPWHFIVITNRETLDKVPDVHPYSQMIRQAPAAIVVCGDTTKQLYEGFWPQDCAAATQNILIAAHALGLASVWLGIYPVKERVRGFQKLLGIPKHIVPISVLPIGYPDENKAPSDRFDESLVHKNKWV